MRNASKHNCVIWNGQVHCYRGVDAGKSKFQHTRGKKRKKVKRDMSKQIKKKMGKATELKRLLKIEEQSLLFPTVCWPPAFQLCVKLICWRRFELQAPWAPRRSSRLPHAFYHAVLMFGPISSSSYSPHPLPFLAQFDHWELPDNPACNDPPCPNNSLILIPLLPAALTSAQCRSMQGHGHIFPMETLFIFCQGSPPPLKRHSKPIF